MNHVLFFCLLIISLKVSANSSQLNNHFLRKVTEKIVNTAGLPVSSWGETDLSIASNSSERRFLRSLKGYNLEDLSEVAFKNPFDATPYNFFYSRGLIRRLKESRLNQFKECKRVWFNDDGVYLVRRLSHLLNRNYSENKNIWYFDYCAGEDKISDNNNLLYFFHGVTGTPFNWIDRKALYRFRKHWRNTGKLPRWVSVSISRAGHFAEGEYEKKFFKYIVPYLEKRFHFPIDRPVKRFALGISLGGANALHIALKKKRFFDAVSLVCPAITVDPPYIGFSGYMNYITRTGAWPTVIKAVLKLIPMEFLNNNFYDNKVDPLQLGQKRFNRFSPPMFIQTSSNDQFGFHEGGRVLALLARSRGVKVAFEELLGSHCVVGPKKIVSFFRKHQKM